MGCCAPSIIDEKPNGICPDCGAETFDGMAIDGCSYSPEICETCGHKPCDQSC